VCAVATTTAATATGRHGKTPARRLRWFLHCKQRDSTNERRHINPLNVVNVQRALRADTYARSAKRACRTRLAARQEAEADHEAMLRASRPIVKGDARAQPWGRHRHIRPGSSRDAEHRKLRARVRLVVPAEAEISIHGRSGARCFNNEGPPERAFVGRASPFRRPLVYVIFTQKETAQNACVSSPMLIMTTYQAPRPSAVPIG